MFLILKMSILFISHFQKVKYPCWKIIIGKTLTKSKLGTKSSILIKTTNLINKKNMNCYKKKEAEKKKKN